MSDPSAGPDDQLESAARAHHGARIHQKRPPWPSVYSPGPQIFPGNSSPLALLSCTETVAHDSRLPTPWKVPGPGPDSPAWRVPVLGTALEPGLKSPSLRKPQGVSCSWASLCPNHACHRVQPLTQEPQRAGPNQGCTGGDQDRISEWGGGQQAAGGTPCLAECDEAGLPLRTQEALSPAVEVWGCPPSIAPSASIAALLSPPTASGPEDGG